MTMEIWRTWPDPGSAWERPFCGAARRSLFLGEEWWRVYSQWFCDARAVQLRVFAFLDGFNGRPRAVLPMFVDGGVLRSCTNYYSPLFGVICPDDSFLDAFTDEFIDQVVASGDEVSSMRMQPMDRDCVFYQRLLEDLRRKRWSSKEFFCFGNWFLPNKYDSYDDYLSWRPSQLQSTIKRKSRKLAKDGGAFAVYQSPGDVSSYFGAFEEVYRRSWKPRESHPGFVRDMAVSLAASNITRLGVLRIRGELAAAQLWLVAGGVASIYKLAHEDRFSAYSPGTLLTAEMLRRALEVDRVSEVDFLTGDDRYKQLWMSRRRERWGIQAHNLRKFRGCVESGIEALKTRLRGPLGRKEDARRFLLGGETRN